MRKRIIVPFAILVTLAFAATVGLQTAAGATTWNSGDIFAAVGNGSYNVYDNTGAFKETISDGLGGFTTGCAFNPDQDKLYTTNFSSSTVSVYDNADPHTIGQSIDTTLQGGASAESIAFAANGDFYVGHARGNADIQRYNAAGAWQQSYDVATEVVGSDWIDLAANQTTMFYTSEGRRVMRYDVASDTQLADFATLPGSSNAFALRLLPPYDGSTGLLVADRSEVKRLDSTGAVIQTYDITGDDGFFSLNLDPDGTSFWTGSFATGNLYRFDIAAGGVDNQLDTIATDSGNLFGVCQKGELTSVPPPSENSCGEIRGDGRLSTNAKTRFVFYNVKSDGETISGEVSFSDQKTNPRLHFTSTAITSLVITGSTVVMKGTGVANGVPVDWVVEGTDGSPDTFSIKLSNGYSASGNVASGRGVNIKPCDIPS